MPTCISTTYKCDICKKEFKGLNAMVLAKKCEGQGVLYEPAFSEEEKLLARYEDRENHAQERAVVIKGSFYEGGTHKLMYKISYYVSRHSAWPTVETISAEKIEKIITVPGQKKIVSGPQDSAPKAV